MVCERRRRRERAKASGWYPSCCAMARTCWRVAAATFCESGASLSTIDTVDTENPQARATSSNVTCPDFRWTTSPPLRSCRPVTAQGPAAQRYSATAAGVRVLPPAFLATTTESPPSVLGPGSRARLPEGYAGCILLIARYLPRYRGYTESAASGPLLQACILGRKCRRAKK